MNEHVIEHADLLLIETIGIVEKEIGDAPQSIDALFRGAALNGIFQF
jgi:hypothetical protein